ncbi:MAG: nicotinate phosphoribosyltransferase [Chloroflexi bacterium]|nr:nicotinate phosphoribosyltransferase [Chloroflexota bacterium]
MASHKGGDATFNNLVNPLLTDFYELTMAYGYWKNGKSEMPAVFDLHFRRCPFDGEFAVFAGLDEVLGLLSQYRIDDEMIEFIRSRMPGRDPGFFEWLRGVDCSRVRLYAMREGTLAFPRVPLLTVEGPLAVCQLLETTLLNLVNFPTLMATNAARFRLTVGPGKNLLEFGLRRAQGPDGGVSASKYSFVGGFDGTSDVLAGHLFDIPVRGTHAHSWVQSFLGLDEVRGVGLAGPTGSTDDFAGLVLECRKELGYERTNDDELAAFIGYALAWPDGFLALVDTYDTLKSGIPNFLAVALALQRLGHQPRGIRLDSGDLAFLSRAARQLFRATSERFGVDFATLNIVASNDLNEETLAALNLQGHEIDTFGIGTHLVTCQAQPSLGGVYKLVQVNGYPRIKLSQDIGKVTIPGRKEAYRLVGADQSPILDLMVQNGEPAPRPDERILCRHPFDETKRAYVTPTAVVPLQNLVWDGSVAPDTVRPLAEVRQYVLDQLAVLRPDHLRVLNPTPYKVSVSERLYEFSHSLWLAEAPVAEIK